MHASSEYLRISLLLGLVLDPEQCSQLSLEEKRELVHEVARWSSDAPTILSSFTRRELLEIICAEMGIERKYPGKSKTKMIEHLLKLVSQKTMRSNSDNTVSVSSAKTQPGNKRQRQKESQDANSVLMNGKEEHNDLHICQNAACRATLCPDYAFCKRCSCCICHYYDENKDPSLWLTCGSDSHVRNSCGLTCHLVCALKDERSGIISKHLKLDGSFYCIACGNVNDIMRSWRKQLLIAKDARRVDVLCQRVLLGYKILSGTKRYKEMHKSVGNALEKLKNELGSLDLVCAKMARGIVNRLSCGAEVQNLCASAVEVFDSMASNCQPDISIKEAISCQVQIKECSPTSVIIELDYTCHLSSDFLGSMLWHRKSTAKNYPEKPTLVILKPDKCFMLDELIPSTEYLCKASLFGNEGVVCEMEAKWTTPSLTLGFNSHSKDGPRKTKLTLEGDDMVHLQVTKAMKKNFSEGVCLPQPCLEVASLTASVSPSTPCKSKWMHEVFHLGCKKRIEETAYEYSVRVVKWLEQSGHINEHFRIKFLTWFSLKATLQERRVVNVFVDALIDDPSSLAGQLIHTFSNVIACEKRSIPPNGFYSSNQKA